MEGRLIFMAIESVREYFTTLGIAHRILEFNVSSATVELAAAAAGCTPARIAKSLSFLVDNRCVMIVTAGDARVDNPKYKAQFGTKAKMLPPEEAEALIGHSVGGICPFAIKDDVQVYLDVSLRRFPTVFPACGNASSAIELSCEELACYAQNMQGWVDLCKAWQDFSL